MVPAQVDRRRSLMPSWTGFVRKISHRVVFFRAYLIRHCPKRGQSATRKWRRFTSGQRACTGYEARKTHSRQQEPASSSHRRHPPGRSPFLTQLKGVGLHPYRIHSALERVPGCAGCPGMLCPRACRNDAARICLYPALDRYGAKILPNCRAIRFEERGRVIERVICELNRRRTSLASAGLHSCGKRFSDTGSASTLRK